MRISDTVIAWYTRNFFLRGSFVIDNIYQRYLLFKHGFISNRKPVCQRDIVVNHFKHACQQVNAGGLLSFAEFLELMKRFMITIQKVQDGQQCIF